MDRPLPARVALVNQPLGLFRSLAMARRNVLSIIPEIAVKQPMVSGKMGKRWHMVCLLYTSPSPRDRQKSRMPSSA